MVQLFHDQGRYNRYEFDSCVYFKQSDDPTYLLLYVDDMLIAAKNKTHVHKLKAQLKKKFDMKYLGETKILGMGSLEIEAQEDFGYLRRTMFSRCCRDSTWQKKDQSFSRSLQIILQVVSTITERGERDVSSTIC